MAYEVLVLDIDGTLTNSKKEISPQTLQSILQIQERGHIVVLASGRPTCGMVKLAKELKLAEYNGYLLSYNGAKITHCKTGNVIYQNSLDLSYIPKLYQDALTHKVGIITYENDGVIAGTPINKYMSLEASINQIPIREVPNFAEYVTFDVNKCLMSEDPALIEQVEKIMAAQYKDELSIFRSEPYFLEIMPKGVDKATALEKLLTHLNLSKEQLICCGDGYNDLTMIEYAGLGVAMANARDVVKKAADYITLSNDHDGIAHVIKEFF